MKIRRQWECNKTAFLKTWPGGYEENFEVYTPKAGLTEQEIVDTCLKPFYNNEGIALEIGCGKGYWVRKYLLRNFLYVAGIDVIPRDWLPDFGFRFSYFEAGNKSYQLTHLDDNSMDFVWCFGVFCHLSLSSIERYLKEVRRVLKPASYASLYFSNNDKRPAGGIETSNQNPDETVGWTENDWPTTYTMLVQTGFKGIREVLKHGADTMVIVHK